MSRSQSQNPAVDVAKLQTVGEELAGMQGPNLAEALRRDIEKLLTQGQGRPSVEFQYDIGATGESGYVRADVEKTMRDGRIKVSVIESSPDFKGTEFVFPAVDRKGNFRLLPGWGVNPRIEPLLTQLTLPPATMLVAQVGSPQQQTQQGAQQQGGAPRIQPRVGPTAVNLAQGLKPLVGKDAVMVFQHKDKAGKETYFYLQTRVSAKQSPAFSSSIAVEKPTKFDATKLDARLAEVAKALGLPNGTKIQPLPFKLDRNKPRTDPQNVLAEQLHYAPSLITVSPAGQATLYPKNMENWNEVGLTTVAVAARDITQTAATVPTAQTPQPLTAKPMTPIQVRDTLHGFRGENVVVVFQGQDPNEVEIVAGQVDPGRPAITAPRRTLNIANGKYRPSQQDQALVAGQLGITPDQVKPVSGTVGTDIATGRRTKPGITVTRDAVRLDSEIKGVLKILKR